jgi:medium-chain acyl-[acyl-carrier-protein] hydrolase
VRLFCFPFGGGTASVYQKWAERVPSWIEVIAVEPPGRGKRLLEAPWTSERLLLEALECSLGPHLDRPFAFYGHSAGAYAAFAAARWCHVTGRPLPVHLFVGAFWSPAEERSQMVPDDVSDEGLLSFYRDFGGFTEDVLGERDLLPARLPALRNDVALVRSYDFANAFALPISVTAISGDADLRVRPEAVERWRGSTSARFDHEILSGGHFFLEEDQSALLRIVVRALGG